TEIRRAEDVDGSFLDVDATISCSSGTYIRSLARDMGVALGTGGHLAALRRTRVGPYDLSSARTLDQLAEEFTQMSLERAVASAFPVRAMDQDETRRMRHGNRIAPRSAGGGRGAWRPAERRCERERACGGGAGWRGCAPHGGAPWWRSVSSTVCTVAIGPSWRPPPSTGVTCDCPRSW